MPEKRYVRQNIALMISEALLHAMIRIPIDANLDFGHESTAMREPRIQP